MLSISVGLFKKKKQNSISHSGTSLKGSYSEKKFCWVKGRVWGRNSQLWSQFNQSLGWWAMTWSDSLSETWNMKYETVSVFGKDALVPYWGERYSFVIEVFLPKYINRFTPEPAWFFTTGKLLLQHQPFFIFSRDVLGKRSLNIETRK